MGFKGALQSRVCLARCTFVYTKDLAPPYGHGEVTAAELAVTIFYHVLITGMLWAGQNTKLRMSC